MELTTPDWTQRDVSTQGCTKVVCRPHLDDKISQLNCISVEYLVFVFIPAPAQISNTTSISWPLICIDRSDYMVLCGDHTEQSKLQHSARDRELMTSPMGMQWSCSQVKYTVHHSGECPQQETPAFVRHSDTPAAASYKLHFILVRKLVDVFWAECRIQISVICPGCIARPTTAQADGCCCKTCRSGSRVE